MFWLGFGTVVFVSLVLAVAGLILFRFLGNRRLAKGLGYLGFALAALFLLSSPFTIASGYELSETTSSTGPGCGSHTLTLVAHSPAGVDLFSFATNTAWCWDSDKVTMAHPVKADISASLPFWRHNSVLDREDTGEGEWTREAHLLAGFRYCLPFVGCIQHVYPRIEKLQYGDGSTAAAIRKPGVFRR